jgi:hypothetical protein
MNVIPVCRYLTISIGGICRCSRNGKSPTGTIAPSAGEVMDTSNSPGCSPFPELPDSINGFRKKFHQCYNNNKSTLIFTIKIQKN